MISARRSILLLCCCSALSASVACSGGSDDDDAEASPTPSPTPFEPTGCQIIWISNDPPGQAQVIDYYVVDAPVGTWVTGSPSYYQGDATGATNVIGAFVDDFDLVAGARAGASIASSGAFTLTVEDTSVIGSSVAFSDDTPQEYFLLDTADNLTASSQGTSGTGSFDGVWSDPSTPDVVAGTGTITILYMGSSLTLGADLAYARCY